MAITNGVSYIITFPFAIVVDEKSPPALAIKASIENAQLRIYRPFRSAPRDFRSVPIIAYNQVPFLLGSEPRDAQWRFAPAPIIHPNLNGLTRATWSVPGLSPGVEDLSKLPKDSLRLDTYGELPDDAGIAVLRWANYLMELLRWRSRQWWISRSSDVFSTAGLSRFPVSETGKPVGLGEGAVRFSAHGFDEQAVNFAMWRQVVDDFNREVQIPEHEMLLMDSIYFKAKNDLRRCVIDAVTAVEQVKDITFRRLWVIHKFESFDRDKVLGRWDLSNHLDTKLQNHFGRSYKLEFPAEWRVIKNLWDARGNIAHGGKNTFGDPSIAVDINIANDFIRTAEHCIKWLEKL